MNSLVWNTRNVDAKKFKCTVSMQKNCLQCYASVSSSLMGMSAMLCHQDYCLICRRKMITYISLSLRLAIIIFTTLHVWLYHDSVCSTASIFVQDSLFIRRNNLKLCISKASCGVVLHIPVKFLPPTLTHWMTSFAWLNCIIFSVLFQVHAHMLFLTVGIGK